MRKPFVILGLAPGDIIAAPEDGERVIRLQEIKDIATFFGHFAPMPRVGCGALT